MPTRKRSRVRPAVTSTTVVVGGGSLGLGMDMGTETGTMRFGAAQTRDMGSETESMDHTEQATVATGTETDSMAATAIGSATYPQGSETAAMVLGAAQTWANGSETDSFTANAVADLSQVTTTGTAVTANTPAWSNPTNAQGAFDSDDAGTPSNCASHPGVSGVDTGFDATLRCSGLVVTATPSGFTRNNVKIRLRHKYDISIAAPVAGVKDVTYQVVLRDSADALISTLKTVLASGGSPTVNPLLTEEFDISGLVSEAQLSAGVKIDVRVFTTGALVVATDGTACFTDGCHLVCNYSRTGIS